MKKSLTFLWCSVLVVLIFATVTYTACNTDSCKDLVCRNGGGCKDGKCSCPDGYSGTYCEIEDPCKHMVCLNNGVCHSGSCDCPFESYGDSCQNELRSDYAKIYVGRYITNTDTIQGWRLSVLKFSTEIKLLKVESMNMIGTVFSTYTIVLTGVHTFDLPEQTERGRTYIGGGTISADSIKLKLKYTTSGTDYNVSYDMAAL